MPLLSKAVSSAPQKSKRPKNLPWYRGLWWSIWLTLIATVIIYGVSTALFFRYAIAPEIRAERESIQAENARARQELRDYYYQQREEYARQIEQWRETAAPGTPVPTFDMHRPSHLRHSFEQGPTAQPKHRSFLFNLLCGPRSWSVSWG